MLLFVLFFFLSNIKSWPGLISILSSLENVMVLFGAIWTATTLRRPSASVRLHTEVKNYSLCCVRPDSMGVIMCFGRVVETCRGALGRYCVSRDLRQYQHGSAGTSVRAQMSKRGQSTQRRLVSPRHLHTPRDSPGVLGTWQGTSGGSSALSCAIAATNISCGDMLASVGHSSSPSYSRQWEISPFVKELSLDSDHCKCGKSSDRSITSAAQSEGWTAALASIYCHDFKKTNLAWSFGHWFGWLICQTVTFIYLFILPISNIPIYPIQILIIGYLFQLILMLWN